MTDWWWLEVLFSWLIPFSILAFTCSVKKSAHRHKRKRAPVAEEDAAHADAAPAAPAAEEKKKTGLSWAGTRKMLRRLTRADQHRQPNRKPGHKSESTDSSTDANSHPSKDAPGPKAPLPPGAFDFSAVTIHTALPTIPLAPPKPGKAAPPPPIPDKATQPLPAPTPAQPLPPASLLRHPPPPGPVDPNVYVPPVNEYFRAVNSYKLPPQPPSAPATAATDYFVARDINYSLPALKAAPGRQLFPAPKRQRPENKSHPSHYMFNRPKVKTQL